VTHDPTFWLLARSSGITAYVLVTLSVLAGLVLKSRPFARLRPATVTNVHRALALNAIGAIVVHGVSLVLDTTVKVSPLALFVPGLVSYRAVATSIGVLAAELTVVVYASFSLRRRIGNRAWRALHWATYGIFALATAHGLAAGTDSSRPWAAASYFGAVGAVVFATAWRALAPKGGTTWPRTASSSTGLSAPATASARNSPRT
jgi:methionine sulfoxide reductase heme-binding subunit